MRSLLADIVVGWLSGSDRDLRGRAAFEYASWCSSVTSAALRRERAATRQLRGRERCSVAHEGAALTR